MDISNTSATSSSSASAHTFRRLRSSSPVPDESASSHTHGEMEDNLDVTNDELMSAVDAADEGIADQPSNKKIKFDNTDDANSLACEPDTTPAEGSRTNTGRGSPPMTSAEAAAAAAAASARWEEALEREDLREITILANKAVIEREVQLQTFTKSGIGKILANRYIGQNKIYYTIPSHTPNLFVKPSGDLHLRAIDGVLLSYNGTHDKMWLNKTTLSHMPAGLKNFKQNPAQVLHVEELKIESLNNARFRMSGAYGKSFELDIDQLQNLINSLAEADIFVTTFDKYLSHRDVVVKQYLDKIVDDRNFNTANRRLNILKFLTLYNDYMKENNCDWPWEYLAQSVINNMMKCFVI